MRRVMIGMGCVALALVVGEVVGQQPGGGAAGAGIKAEVVVHLDGVKRKISPNLFGIFFEDLNYAADGGLYAEQVQNRSFEYTDAEVKGWNALTNWELVERGVTLSIHPSHNVPGDTTAHERLNAALREYKRRIAGV